MLEGGVEVFRSVEEVVIDVEGEGVGRVAPDVGEGCVFC